MAVNIRTDGTWLQIYCTSYGGAAALTLQEQLARYGGAPTELHDTALFQAPGIVVALTEELVHPPGFHGLLSEAEEPPGTLGWLEHDGSLYIYGRTPQHLEAAVWRLLEWLGYAHLRPGTDWEILPSLGPDVAVDDRSYDLPLFFVPPGTSGALMPPQYPIFDEWYSHQGMPVGGKWPYGHVWGAFAGSEGLATDGVLQSTKGNKLACASPTLQEIFINHSVGQLTEEHRGLSASHADGSAGWTEPLISNEGVTMSPADRQQRLARTMQEYIDEQGFGTQLTPTLFDPVHVITQAYGDSTSPACTEPVHPDQVVLVCTDFVRGGRSIYDIGSDYDGAHVGTYDAADVWQWTFMEPGRGSFGSRANFEAMVDRWFPEPAPRVVDGCETWGAYARGMWACCGDDPLARWDAYVGLAFPSAPGQAAVVYDLLEDLVPVTTDWLHRLAVAVQDLLSALPWAGPERNRALDHARHVVGMHLLHLFQSTPSGTTLQPWLEWSYRCFKDGRWIMPYRLPYFDGTWATYLAQLGNPQPGSPPWTYTPILEPELLAQLALVVAQNPLMPFTPRSWNLEDLVPVTRFATDPRGRGAAGAYSWSKVVWKIASPTNVLQLSGQGQVAGQNLGDSVIRVYDQASNLVSEQVVPYSTSVQPLAPIPVVPLEVYTLVFEDPKAGGTKITWPDTYFAVHELQDTTLAWTVASLVGYFYVVDTTPIGLYNTGGSAKLVKPDGTQISLPVGFSTHTVQPSEAGQYWRLYNVPSRLMIYTHPPLFTLHPSEGLLPRELGVP